MIGTIVSAALTMAIVHITGASMVPAILIAITIGITVPVAIFALSDIIEAEPQHQIRYGNSGMTIEELAQKLDTPTWILAPAMARLINRGLLAAPDGTTPDAHITHLETAYPKPQNVVS